MTQGDFERVTHAVRLLAGAFILFGSVACGEEPGGQDRCSFCHTAPDSPVERFEGLDGADDTTDPGVGAHAQHLWGGTYSQKLVCDDCHVVPEGIDAEGHFVGGRGEVRFSALAGSAGVQPRWDSETRTCSNVYCHGALPPIPGTEDDADVGPKLSPVWNQEPAARLACDACHGTPPTLTRTGLAHPPSPACQTCHPTANEALEITNRVRHMDGVLDVQD